MRLLEVLLVTLGGVWQGARQDFNLFEIVLIAIGVWAWRNGWRPNWPRWRLPQGWPAVAGIAVAVLLLRLAFPAPIPVVSDEFSHTLLADTLRHGRVANPTHAFWPHFESLHILQRPAYVSNYFPGHAAVLALFATPWYGVLLESCAFLFVLYWMLYGWMPRRWALFGVLLAALRFCLGSYWINALHGGFLPALGGALVAGAYARLSRRASMQQGLVLGVGLSVLAATRPFEGVLFSAPFVLALLWQRRWMPLAAMMVIVGASLAGLGVYVQRITGSAFVTPYQISQKTYGWPMSLAWTPPPQVHNRHLELARYYDYEVEEHQKVDGPANFIEFLAFRMQEYWRFYVGPLLTIPLLLLGRVRRRRPMLLAGLAGGLFAISLEGAASPHYLAPAAAVIVALLVEGCRHLRASRIDILPLLPATMALILFLRVAAQAAGLPYTQQLNYQSWCCKVEGNLNKARITRELGPGRHLVFVKAKSDPYNFYQWIYNAADIDAAPVVWARDLGPEENRRLIEYCKDRTVWLVDPNVEPASLTSY